MPNCIADDIKKWMTSINSSMTKFSMIVEFMICIIAFALTSWLLNRPRNLPPGPWGLPIVGILPYLEENPGKSYTRMAAKYGDIFSVRLGGRLAIVLNGYDAMREAFVKNGDVFSGRPYDARTLVIGKETIARQPDSIWKHTRKLYRIAFRRFGLNNDFGAIEVKTREEMEHLYQLLDNTKGEDIENFLIDVMKKYVCNLITSIVYGARHSYDNEWFETLHENSVKTQKSFDNSKLINSFPLLLKLSLLVKKVEVAHDVLREMAARYINDHKVTLDPQNPRDVLDVFMTKSVGSDENGDGRVIDDEDFLLGEFGGLLRTATSTTAVTLTWIFMYMAHYQEVQEQLHQELDKVHRSDTTWISTSQRIHLPFTVACMNEVMRHTSLDPIGIQHATTSDIRFRGFDIPGKTMVIANVYSVHMDERYWKNPQDYDPSRWIEDGKLVKRKAFVPFSIGPRFCVARQLAEQELFLVFANLMNRYHFLPPEGADGVDFSGAHTTLLSPVFPKLRVLRRKCVRI
ncbi:cytochrome P450 2J5-like [Glandiceps talaboti]